MAHGGRREGAGRKPKLAREKQRHSVTAKLTDAELAALEKAADGAPLGAYVRAILLRALARRGER